MSSQFYDPFYKRYGIRIVDQLMRPPMHGVDTLDLPKESILHFTTVSPAMLGPAEDDLMFQHITRPIAMDHVSEIGAQKGSPHRMSVNPLVGIRSYMSKHRRFRWIHTLEAGTRDPSTLYVLNYGLIPSTYRYMRSLYTEYNKWWNLQAAVWKKAGEIAQSSSWNQFVVCHLPTILPSMPDLRQALTGMNSHVLKIFDSPESLMILELWKWFGPERESSVLNALPEKYYDRINIIFQESGKWYVMNLGKMNSWRQSMPEEIETYKAELLKDPTLKDRVVAPNEKGLPPDHFQRRFLRLMMSTMAARSVAPVEVTDTANGADPTVVPEGEQQFDAAQDPVVVQQTSLLPQLHDDGSFRISTKVEPIPADIRTRNLRIDAPDDTAADIKHSPEFDKQIMLDLAQLEIISKQYAEQNRDIERKFPEEHAKALTGDKAPYVHHEAVTIPGVVTLEDGVKQQCDRLANSGMISGAEYRRFMKLAGSYRTIKAPDGSTTLDQFIQINPDTLKITESPAIADIRTVPDKSMLKSSLHTFDSTYINKVMQKDVAGMVMNMQKGGIAVTNYEVEHVDSVLGAFNMYTVHVTPVEGASSRLRFELPVINEDGIYMANGVKYRMRKQRGDMPINKIAPDSVALASYYGKTFVNRSDKRVNDYGLWLRNQIMARGLDDADQTVLNLHPGECYDNLFKGPRLYSTLSMGLRGFDITVQYPNPHGEELKPATPAPVAKASMEAEKVMNASVMAPPVKKAAAVPPKPVGKAAVWPAGPMLFHLSFDHTKRKLLYGPEKMEAYERDGTIIVGRRNATVSVVPQENDPFILMDTKGIFWLTLEDGSLKELGPIELLIGLDRAKAPVEFAEMKISGRTIPVGIILGYEMGLDKLMQFLHVRPRRVPAGTRVQLQPSEYSLVFADETLVFNKSDAKASMILAGFNEYHRAIRQYSVYEFDRRGIYLNVLESGGASARFLREIDLLYQMFIDPITRELLVEMHEPTDMRSLLIRCCEMLMSDTHPDKMDPAFMRVKGYERMAGAVYSELVRSIRVHNGKSGKARLPIDLNPYAVWKNISEDPSKTQVLDINPIECLKEIEAVTYNGVGGRNSRSMTKHTRSYHRNDMGTISESTVDSSDVAINTYTSADPMFKSLRGVSHRYDIKTSGATSLLSTSALVSPASDRDDPKRVNFIGIQHTHGIACQGYRQVPVRTGYEQVIAHRTNDLFALTAKKPGKVESITQHGMVIVYDDGEKKGVELGRRFGAAAGLTIPHSVVTGMKAGMKFVPGDVLCYNTGFFEADVLNPKNVVWKAGTLVTTVLWESAETLEDSAAISEKAAELLSTAITKTKHIVISFDQSVHKLLEVGTKVESESILCIIEDAVTTNSGLFDENSWSTLSALSSQAPKAKMKGVIERIEVYYNGDKADMSAPLRELADKYDKDMLARSRSIGKSGYTGSVDEGFRVEGDPLIPDTMAIKVYITGNVAAGVGDKGVFCNQMKTVFGKVLTGEVVTESGLTVDAIFGQKSIADRIVTSPEVIGTTTTLLGVIGRQAAKIYRSS